MAVNVRREPLGRLSLQPGNNNNRLSLAGVAPLKPNVLEGRPSIAGRRESTAGSGRPSTAAYSRPSLGGASSWQQSQVQSGASSAQGRQSLGGNPPAPNRRTSVSVINKAADPRPIGKKEYTALCIKTILNYLSTHSYDQACTAKQLSSPTKADFKNIVTFLIKQLDPNFEFGSNLEEEFRVYMKQFGYPVTISKTALIPVGSPHTWPHVLAAIVWLVEYLSYEETLSFSKTDNLEDDIAADAEESGEAAIHWFEHNVKAFCKFMDGDDEAIVRMDEDLMRAYQEKNKRSSDTILKLQAKVDELKAEKLRLKNPDIEIKRLESTRETLKQDAEKFKACVAQLRAHKAQQAALLEKTQGEYEEQHKLLIAAEEEKQELQAILAKQEFTPLQVQEMNHQKESLKAKLDSLEAQKTSVQQEIWSQETSNSKAIFDLDKRIKIFNECAMLLELTPASARHARGTDFQLKMHPQKKEVCNMVGLDLTKTVKPALAGLKKHLATEITSGQSKLRDLGSQLASIVEMRDEQTRRVKSLEERAVRHEEAYRQEKGGCEVEINGSLERIEGVELLVSQMRAAQSHILEESETRIHQLDNELVQQRQIQIAARDKLVREMKDMSERVLEHKTKVSKVLKEALSSVTSTKDYLNRPFRTPGRPSRPDKP